MALEDVRKAILEKARRRAGREEAKAGEEAERILEEARREAGKLRSERLASARKELEAVAAREASSLRFSASRDELTVRKQTMEELEVRFRSALEGLPAAGHERLLEALLRGLGPEWKGGRVRVRREHQGIAEKVLEGLPGLEPGAPLECLGGAMVETPDGTKSLDLRYETLMEDVWRDELPGISRELFDARGDEAEPAQTGR